MGWINEDLTCEKHYAKGKLLPIHVQGGEAHMQVGTCAIDNFRSIQHYPLLASPKWLPITFRIEYKVIFTSLQSIT